MESFPREVVLTLIFAALGIYFSVLVVRGVAGYLFFRRLRPTALLTWPGRRPPNLSFLLGLGVVAAAVAVLNGLMQRPAHHVYSQGIMALYFILMVPLSTRIHQGLYRDGVWAERGFLPYERIGRMAFREFPEIELILVPRGGSGSFRLRVPPDEYGAVRKVLEEKIRARVLHVDAAILGLE